METARRPSAVILRLHLIGLLGMGMIVEHDVGAFLGEPQRDARADALAAAGDENDFVREFHRDLRVKCSFLPPLRQHAPRARESFASRPGSGLAPPLRRVAGHVPPSPPRCVPAWMTLAPALGAEHAQLPRPLCLFGGADAAAARPEHGRRRRWLGRLGLHAGLLHHRAVLRLSGRPLSPQISHARRRAGLEPGHGGHGAGAELSASFLPSGSSSGLARPASSRWARAGFPISSPGRAQHGDHAFLCGHSVSARPSASPSAAISRSTATGATRSVRSACRASS